PEGLRDLPHGTRRRPPPGLHARPRPLAAEELARPAFPRAHGRSRRRRRARLRAGGAAAPPGLATGHRRLHPEPPAGPTRPGALRSGGLRPRRARAPRAVPALRGSLRRAPRALREEDPPWPRTISRGFSTSRRSSASSTRTSAA